MPYTIAAVLSLVALAGGLTAWHRIRHLRRVILRERAAARLTGAANHRDLTAFRHRIDQAIAQQRVLEEADAIVDRELARTTRNTSQEGDLP